MRIAPPPCLSAAAVLCHGPALWTPSVTVDWVEVLPGMLCYSRLLYHPLLTGSLETAHGDETEGIPTYLQRRTFFSFVLMTTGAFSQNISKLFFKLKLVTDNLPLRLCRSQLRSHALKAFKSLLCSLLFSVDHYMNISCITR